jgi:hypothetical protein
MLPGGVSNPQAATIRQTARTRAQRFIRAIGQDALAAIVICAKTTTTITPSNLKLPTLVVTSTICRVAWRTAPARYHTK